MQAERQKRYRARKKAAKMAETEPTEGRCEKKKKDRTEYNRKYREKKRQEMSRQKKQAIKAKDELERVAVRGQPPQLPHQTPQRHTRVSSKVSSKIAARRRDRILLRKAYGVVKTERRLIRVSKEFRN